MTEKNKYPGPFNCRTSVFASGPLIQDVTAASRPHQCMYNASIKIPTFPITVSLNNVYNIDISSVVTQQIYTLLYMFVYRCYQFHW